MSECRKVQELTKEFLKKLLKVKRFKERVISHKSNNLNFEPKRIRSKNINSNTTNEMKINIQTPFSLSDGINIKPKNHIKKIPPLMTPLIIQNDNSKEKEILFNMKSSQRKLPKIEKPKTSEKFKEKEKLNSKTRKFEEKKNDIRTNNNDFQQILRSKEEPIKKIKIISKIEDDVYERLLNRNNKIKRISSSESPKVRKTSFENKNNLTLEKRNSLDFDDTEKRKKKIKKKKFQLPSLFKEIKLQYCVYPGNNAKLIDTLMEQRSDKWVKTGIDLVKFCDFIWSPLPNVIFNYSNEKKQFVNHIEFCSNLSNKLNLYYNLFRHCESKKLNLFDYFPFTICLSLSQSNFKNQIESFKQFCLDLPDYTPKSEVKYVEKFSILGSKRTGENQTINIPSTYNTGSNMWIIKPINLNRGRCIQVLNDTDAIVEYLEKLQEMKKLEGENNNNFKCEHILLQKYLERPLLYQGRKFDIRIWIMLISGQENFVYIFKQGHLKATCGQYDINSSSPFIHLTNYSVQKHNADFSKIEIGNEISYEEFQEELDKTNTGKNFFKDIYPKIVYIIRLAVGSGKSNLNHLNRTNCFEIFGCDFILDQKFKPYLLEINLNPGLEISSPLISKLVPRMVDDALKLTIDAKYYKNKEESSKYHVDGYDDNENMWERFNVI